MTATITTITRGTAGKTVPIGSTSSNGTAGMWRTHGSGGFSSRRTGNGVTSGSAGDLIVGDSDQAIMDSAVLTQAVHGYSTNDGELEAFRGDRYHLSRVKTAPPRTPIWFADTLRG